MVVTTFQKSKKRLIRGVILYLLSKIGLTPVFE